MQSVKPILQQLVAQLGMAELGCFFGDGRGLRLNSSAIPRTSAKLPFPK
jgi:hypothetical protein